MAQVSQHLVNEMVEEENSSMEIDNSSVATEPMIETGEDDSSAAQQNTSSIQQQPDNNNSQT